MTKWTKEEIQTLKNNYLDKSHKYLCNALFNRTWDAIQRKARLLKLHFGRYGLTTEERFWRYVEKKSDHECWNWTGACNNDGYGHLNIKNKTTRITRFSWTLHNGMIPKETPCVLHHCDNPKCVNPNHLFLGTQADNVEDMINKGRDNKARQKGEDNANHKLTLNEVKEIRRLHKKKQLTKKQIGEIFNVHQVTISRICNNKSWHYR